MAPSVFGLLFVAALVLPLLGSAAALLARRAGWGNALSQYLFMLSGVLGLAALAGYFTALHAASSVVLLSSPVLAFSVTPLSAFFLLIVYLGTFITSLYALGYLPLYADAYSVPLTNAVSGVFLFALAAVLLSTTVFTFLLSWELMSLSAYFLVIADRSPESLSAGFLYLVMTHIGFACLSAGFLLLSGGHAFISFDGVREVARQLNPAALAAAFALLFIGFGSKAGLVPLHQWLPYAHPQAPSHSSALLSGTMLKVALYGFLLALTLFPGIPASWAFTVAAVGLISAFFGALSAAVEHDAKRLLAWSSVENMGLIFSGVGIALVLHGLSMPLSGALAAAFALFVAFHVLNHFAFKTGLFLATGAMVAKTHTRDLDLYGGLAGKWPAFSGVFLVLVIAAAALPPSGTFFGEWLYLQSLAAALRFSSPLLVASAAAALGLAALVGGLALFAFVKFFSAAFLGRARSEHAEAAEPMPVLLLVPPLLCAAFSVLLGLFGLPVLSAATAGFGSLVPVTTVVPGASMSAWFVFALLAFASAFAFIAYRVFARNRTVRRTETWDCGTPLTPRMEYTATGFSAPMRFFFRGLVMAQKEILAEAVVPGNPWIANRRIEWSIASVWEAWLYRRIARGIVSVAAFVKRLQNGVIQLYLLFVLLALIIVVLVAL
ncbi:MAG: hypothetical protein KGI41_02650 [Patescibacteria group bacterium]|nr:hypothetical protein [Patescibacteria group bacterium]MDE1966115.1 hypothetical protein [Patescibacteria group bacterium]